MITLDEARALAVDYISRRARSAFCIVDEATIDRPFGWMFFWSHPARRVDGRSPIGNAPVIVNRHTGRLSPTDTSATAEDLIAAYEALGAERFDRGEWREFIGKKLPEPTAAEKAVLTELFGPRR